MWKFKGFTGLRLPAHLSPTFEEPVGVTLFGAVGLEEREDILSNVFYHPCGEVWILQMRDFLRFDHLIFLQEKIKCVVLFIQLLKTIYNRDIVLKNTAVFCFHLKLKPNYNTNNNTFLPEQCHWRESTWQAPGHYTSDCRASSQYPSGCWLVYCCPWKAS